MTVLPQRRHQRRPLRRGLAFAAAPLAVALPLLAAAPAAGADPTEGACAPGQGVTVVVDATSVQGPLQVRCAPGDPVDGIQALKAAGYDVVTQSFSFGDKVCLVDGAGDPCEAPFVRDFWGFFLPVDGSWAASGGGASSVDPVPGDVHGWRWGPGDVGPSVPAPAAGPARPGGTGTPDPAATDKAAAYLAAQLRDGAVPGFDAGPAYDLTTDAGFGLLAAGTQDAALDALLDVLERDAARYVHGQAFDGERPDAVYAGPAAKLGLLALLAGGDPRDVGGLDLVADLVSTEDDAGRFVDRSALGDDSNVFTQSFGVLLLEQAPDVDPSAPAVDLLLGAQCTDGGFPVNIDEEVCTSDADATGIALQALAALRDGDGGAAPAAGQALARAVAFLFAVQLEDGAFGSTAPGATGANVNSTGYAAMGLAAAGQDVTEAREWLSSVLRLDGGLPVTDSADAASDVFATSQALPALTARGFVGTAREVARPTEPTAPTAPTAPVDPGPTDPVPTEPVPTQPTGSGTTAPTATGSGSPTAVLGDRASGSTTAAARAGRLARTGSDVVLPLGAGAVLLVAGTGVVLATRRRGSHQ
jgi:hypothetical protein